jgi:hypothetical protein
MSHRALPNHLVVATSLVENDVFHGCLYDHVR